MNRPRLFVSYSHHPVQQKQAADIFLQWLREIDGLEIHTDEEVETPQGHRRAGRLGCGVRSRTPTG